MRLPGGGGGDPHAPKRVAKSERASIPEVPEPQLPVAAPAARPDAPAHADGERVIAAGGDGCDADAGLLQERRPAGVQRSGEPESHKVKEKCKFFVV